ncbi:hypothetical protein GGR50DRAFT_591666 [Xylaria sp. CBS 124048]|nr:hypothetical protein GGR50DRAFT_591666 [Xylaria sp. CBS 124048]
MPRSTKTGSDCHQTSQNLCSATCPVDHIAPESTAIKEPSGSWPDIRGFNSLNYSRTAWLSGDAIEVSLAVYKESLPRRLQEKIDIVIPGVDPKVWSTGNVGAQALKEAIQHPAKRALARMKRTEYSFIPICTNGDHWVLVVIHKEHPREVAPGSAEAAEYSHVAQIAVLDPFHDAQRLNMVHRQMKDWLHRAGGLSFSPFHRRPVWIPSQHDGTSCGPRVYWNAKQIIDRLLELHELESSYDENIWRPLSGWFNEHFVRGEMLGRCAWEGIRAMDYKARMAIECVNRVRQNGAKTAKWERADKLMAPPDLSAAVPEKRPAAAAPGKVGGLGRMFGQAGIGELRAPGEAERPTILRKGKSLKQVMMDLEASVNQQQQQSQPANAVLPLEAPIPNQHLIAQNLPGISDLQDGPAGINDPVANRAPTWPPHQRSQRSATTNTSGDANSVVRSQSPQRRSKRKRAESDSPPATLGVIVGVPRKSPYPRANAGKEEEDDDDDYASGSPEALGKQGLMLYDEDSDLQTSSLNSISRLSISDYSGGGGDNTDSVKSQKWERAWEHRDDFDFEDFVLPGPKKKSRATIVSRKP